MAYIIIQMAFSWLMITVGSRKQPEDKLHWWWLVVVCEVLLPLDSFIVALLVLIRMLTRLHCCYFWECKHFCSTFISILAIHFYDIFIFYFPAITHDISWISGSDGWRHSAVLTVSQPLRYTAHDKVHPRMCHRFSIDFKHLFSVLLLPPFCGVAVIYLCDDQRINYNCPSFDKSHSFFSLKEKNRKTHSPFFSRISIWWMVSLNLRAANRYCNMPPLAAADIHGVTTTTRHSQNHSGASARGCPFYGSTDEHLQYATVQ